MLKRKREPWPQTHATSGGSNGSNNYLPSRLKRTATTYSDDSSIEDVTDQFRAGVKASVINKSGMFTPLTDGTNSGSLNRQPSEEEELEAAPKFVDTKTTPRILIPDCRDGPAYPRSLYQGYKSPFQELSEHEAVTRLSYAHEQAHKDDNEQPEYTYFSLDGFSMYRPLTSGHHANELVTLDKLSKDSYPEFCFDGVLSVGNQKYFVRNVKYAKLTVDGYGDPDISLADMSKQLCIQSAHAGKRNVWYKLGTPAKEYDRFYQPFLWLVRFTKQFVDYLLCTERVSIAHFREAFHRWLSQAKHAQDPSLNAWLHEAKLQDFRTTVAAHVDFLWKECYGTQQPSDEISICDQPLWGEVHPARLKAIPEQPNLAKKTVVTPFAYDCFKSMYFADQFQETPITDVHVRDTVRDLKAKLGLTPLYEPQTATLTPVSNTPELVAPGPVPDASLSDGSICVGDVVMLPPEKEGSWRSDANCWYAYVQRIHATANETTRIDVIWLYHASDTTIGNAYYPFHNELFFSDNCGCDTKDDQESWNIDEVIGKVNVSWFACNPYQANEKGLFVRQKFRTVPEMDHFDFVTLQENDFRCHHQSDYIRKEEGETFDIGDVVIVRTRDNPLCEIAQIIERGRGRRLRLRKLQRKRDRRPSARANELFLTSEILQATCHRTTCHKSNTNDDDMDESEDCEIIRKCHVKSFSREEIDNGILPTPYDRNGAGDFFVIEADMTEDAEGRNLPGIGIAPELERNLPPLNEGWDPQTDPALAQLTGLGIFCGGGTFDRGLEEGGAVKFRHAVDWAEHALHSYRANLEQPQEVNFFLGSVDDYLAKALSGQSDVAKPSTVHVISAGSPCQGFSRMQLDTSSVQSRKNASMVASVVAFADLYCPHYMVLENVVSMTECRNERKEHNVFSQILAALVGLGCQIQQFLVDSWSHSSSQQRSRLFIIATAPGLTPPPQPECSHAHPPNISTRSLGKSSNGLPFGTRNINPDAALPHISPQEAVGDLPPVYDSQVQLCPAYPDHRTATNESSRSRLLMRAVPIRPYGMTLVQAWEQGMLSGQTLEFCETRGAIRRATTSKMYARIFPDKLFPTIITKLAVADGMNGRCMHFSEHRVITVMEAKRAQGYLDHEVLVGSATQQMKIVGNSVDRSTALVLGLSLRKSWMTSQFSAQNTLDIEDGEVDIQDNAFKESSEVDMFLGKTETSVENLKVDNRTVKMSLTLSSEEIEEVNKATATTGRTFKELLRILSRREEHQAARQSIHGKVDGAQL